MYRPRCSEEKRNSSKNYVGIDNYNKKFAEHLSNIIMQIPHN